MKLPNGMGNVSKLSGKRRNPWRARKTTGWIMDETTGKLKQQYINIGYYPTRQEALQALASYNEDPYDIKTNKITFSELYERWSGTQFGKVSDSTVKSHENAYKLCGALYDMPVKDITLDHLQSVIDNSGKNTPTLKKLLTLFNQMYDFAVIRKIVKPDDRAMLKYLDILQPGNPNALDREPFTKKEIKLLWDVEKSNEYISIVLILIYTGVRIGELLSLEKKDIHLEERWLYIDESKTESGVREVPIAEKIVPFIEYWIKKDCEYLICTPDEEPFTYRNYYDSYWKPLMVQLGMGEYVIEKGKDEPVYKGHRPHDTRHTCISLLTEAEVDERFIKKIVGHKGQNVTEAVYTHIELPVKLNAINKI